ncbi:hypothetical protein ABW20_dc0110326 [Dactylellina cionopaga]|nr:hypothetical protein ABW20_dc0110326 [Dactylellina cionopaga]
MTTQTDTTVIQPRISLRSNPDLAIRCDDYLFKVHQDQIIDKSTLLTNIQYNGVYNGIDEVQTKDTKPEVLSCILDFLYLGTFDETGLYPYIPSTCQTAEDGSKHTPIRSSSPSDSPSTEQHKRLAAIYTLAQRYKISGLKELVEEKFASAGKVSDYLSEILKDVISGPSDVGKRLQAKLQKVATTSQEKPQATLLGGSVDDNNGRDTTGVTTPESFIVTPPEEETLVNPSNTPVTSDITSTSGGAGLQALNDNLQRELETLRSSFEQQIKELKDQKNQLLVLQQEKFQADLCRDTAQGRLEGLMKVLNDTKRCKNNGCRVSLDVLIQENEVRTMGNVTIRCGVCNARQR